MKPKSLEFALQRWDKWNNSINKGRKILSVPGKHPALVKMRKVAQEFLTEMEFPACPLMELYWLCCIFSHYDRKCTKKDGIYDFEMLVLPDWFPFPFGFNWEEHINKNKFNFQGRIYPPEVWGEKKREFEFSKSPIAGLRPHEEWKNYYEGFPDTNFFMVLGKDHPIHKYVRKGRPDTPMACGETLVDVE